MLRRIILAVLLAASLLVPLAASADHQPSGIRVYGGSTGDRLDGSWCWDYSPGAANHRGCITWDKDTGDYEAHGDLDGYIYAGSEMGDQYCVQIAFDWRERNPPFIHSDMRVIKNCDPGSARHIPDGWIENSGYPSSTGGPWVSGLEGARRVQIAIVHRPTFDAGDYQHALRDKRCFYLPASVDGTPDDDDCTRWDPTGHINLAARMWSRGPGGNNFVASEGGVLWYSDR